MHGRRRDINIGGAGRAYSSHTNYIIYNYYNNQKSKLECNYQNNLLELKERNSLEIFPILQESVSSAGLNVELNRALRTQ